MNSIFNDTTVDFMVVYLDDLLVYSDSYEDQLSPLELLLSCLMDNDLYVWKSKCEIFTT